MFLTIYLLIGMIFTCWFIQQPEMDKRLDNLNPLGQLVFYCGMIAFGPIILVVSTIWAILT